MAELQLIEEKGRDNLAKVYIAKLEEGKPPIEFAESLQPPLSIDEKWVLMISCLYGCPVQCLMCDAGWKYQGKISKQAMLAQIDHIVSKRYPSGEIPAEKFKIQFARMGEPAFNLDVLEVLKELPTKYKMKRLIPCVSTIAPQDQDEFFTKLIEIKNNQFTNGNFQLQFSIHCTDEDLRNKLIPIDKWNFEQIAAYGDKFYKQGDRKITLNFAISKQFPVSPDVIAKYFNPDKFLIKITPLNPTNNVEKNALDSALDPDNPNSINNLVEGFRKHNFEVIISIGELEENQIGSNCGQYIRVNGN